ncbi:solute carrier family 52, riboflavin transporter, member 3-A-like isoform X4 [Daktulosphaira vitifoliae]|uniref:solute carrier family 52, riboflavin transporter, member 3-A-like isoform X4 n=1 Tax=Daktulosphaira vitifoliae TaxID=58002 RepID=UPI0021AAFD1D|nr:solute carrier family 52, riboflavin transporter, member 3-A-like isoform X4 [Daktulosphaira vitifoliae]
MFESVDEKTHLMTRQMKLYSLERSMVVERKWFLDLFTLLFGIGAWILVNSLYTQLPLLIQTTPEGWTLPSYISILVQIGNLGPLTYSIWRTYFGNKYDRSLTVFILIVGSVSMFLMAGFYKTTLTIFGEPHSVLLFLLTFGIAIVGCTSSVLFIPSLSRFPGIYLITYMIGEGLSGLLPSFIAIVQGISLTSCTTIVENGHNVTTRSTTNANFSSKLFFVMIGFIMCASMVSYICLEYLPICKKEKLKTITEAVEINEPIEDKKKSRIFLLFLQGTTAFFSNGLLISFQSFSCLPYGIFAYHLATNFSNIINPVACFISLYTNRTSKNVLNILYIICKISTICLLITAFANPTPPLYNTTTGIVIIVFIWVLYFGCASYVKLSIAAILRNQGNKGLFYYGCITQIGSASGALIAFYIINIAKMLNTFDPCLNVSEVKDI